MIQKSKADDFIDFTFPCIVKPLNTEASEGISLQSVAHNPKQIIELAEKINKKWNCDSIVEQFIEGREFYVGVLGGAKPKAFFPQELSFGKNVKPLERFATYQAKWSEKYRKAKQIKAKNATNLSKSTRKELMATAVDIFKTLGLDGYARIDFRMDEHGEIFFLEANPNPSINKKDEFARSAIKDGVAYDDLIEKIIKLAKVA